MIITGSTLIQTDEWHIGVRVQAQSHRVCGKGFSPFVTWYTFTLTRLKNSANRKRTCNRKHKIRSGCSNSSIRNRPQSEIAPLVCHRYTYTAKVINPVLPSLNLATWYCANNPAHTLDQSASLPPFTHTSHHWPAAPHMKSCLQSHELPSKDQTKQKTCLFLAQVNRKRTLPLYWGMR